MTSDPGGMAATKFVSPLLPARHVVREVLARSLFGAVASPRVKVILVSAPAGSGKTTLATSLSSITPPIETGPPDVAWLHLDPPDADPARFWMAVARAVDQVRPGVADAVAPVARSTRGDADSVVPTLVNLVAGGAPLVLVLDDYQVIGDDDVHAGLDQLIELLPPGVTLVIGTRVDPPLRLGRLRVRGQLIEIRADDLRFAPEEASDLLGLDHQLGPDDVARLCRRTEGWAAGLVLAGLSLRRAPDPGAFVDAFGGDDQLVIDYLSDELFHSLGDGERERLAITSVVDRLSGPLVDHLSGTSDGARWLAGMAAANQLLLPLDNRGVWYRHHQLVLDLLRADAATLLGDRRAGLHARAAEWFHANGLAETAVRHWIAAGRVDHAAEVLHAGLGWWMIAGGEHDTLRRILGQLGDAAVSSTVGTTLEAAWCALISDDIDDAQRLLARARAMKPAPDLLEAPLFDALAIFIELGRGDVGAALSIAGPALDPARLEAQISPMATLTGAAHAWAGRLVEARQALAIAQRRAHQDGVVVNEAMAPMYLSLVEAEVGTRAAAHDAANRSIDLAVERHLDRYQRLAVAYAVRAATGVDRDLAAADIEHALELISRPTNVLDQAYVTTIAADIHLAGGDARGPDLLARARELLAPCPDPGVAGSRLSRVVARHRGIESGTPRRELVEQLTDRELAVLHHLPTTLSQREIAADLYVSLNTVKTHCRSIFRKLSVGDRREAVQRARELDLL